jgi:predicted PurR-regulated permease PerM
VLLLFLLAYGPRFCQGALRQIRDDDRRAATAAVISGASTRARRYTLTTLLHVMIVVVLASGTFYALDLPAPFVVGLLFGAVGAIPFLGFVLGGIPALLLAVADGDVVVIVVVAAFVIGAQSIEALVIRPRVDAHTVRLGPALAMIVALLGFELYGVGGAAYALIALVFILAALDEWTRWNARPHYGANP